MLPSYVLGRWLFFNDMEELSRNMNLNNRFIQDLTVEEKRAFSIVLKIKAKHTNSIIYDFSHKSFSKKIGVSEYFSKKYVDIIIRKGWAYINEENELVVLSLSKIFKERGFKEYSIEIKAKDKISDIVDKINLILLKKNISSQKRVVSLKNYDQYSRVDCSKEKLSQKDYKKLLKAKKNNPELFHGVFVRHSVIGMRKLSEILKCSISSAHRFLQRMAKMGIVSLTEMIETIATGVGNCKYIPESEFGYYFVHRNCLYRHTGTRIVFS